MSIETKIIVEFDFNWYDEEKDNVLKELDIFLSYFVRQGQREHFESFDISDYKIKIKSPNMKGI